MHEEKQIIFKLVIISEMIKLKKLKKMYSLHNVFLYFSFFLFFIESIDSIICKCIFNQGKKKEMPFLSRTPTQE